MIIPGDVKQAYDQVWFRLIDLEKRTEPFLRGAAHKVNGEYIHRIKPIESLLLKIEKEGMARPFEEIEDLFAATIIVPNSALIPAVEEDVRSRFGVVREVPPKTKKPEQFVYDDRHLILRLKPEPGREDSKVENLIFELQIKTKMQAAAAAVSRDLSYKTKRLSWTLSLIHI